MTFRFSETAALRALDSPSQKNDRQLGRRRPERRQSQLIDRSQLWPNVTGTPFSVFESMLAEVNSPFINRLATVVQRAPTLSAFSRRRRLTNGESGLEAVYANFGKTLLAIAYFSKYHIRFKKDGIAEVFPFAV